LPDLATQPGLSEKSSFSTALYFPFILHNFEGMAVEISVSASDTTLKRKKSKKFAVVTSVNDTASSEANVKEKKRKKKANDRSAGAYVE